MKVSYKHLLNNIESNPSIKELSDTLFQLGHEHDINENIFDIEFTPNRGDCLSLKGILRDLAPFYKINLNKKLYESSIDTLELDFVNNAKEDCPHISFLRIDISKKLSIPNYKNELNNYFEDLGLNKINFFTDISNYVSYETGQPTHCYDFSKIKSQIKLEEIKGNHNFETLLGNKITLKGKNLVFMDGAEIINLAGIMGGMNSCCSENTSSVLVECAYFNPEKILGKSIKYDLISDAAHKFERYVDPYCQIDVLKRFLYIVSEHVDIKDVKIFTSDYKEKNIRYLKDDLAKINKILGTSLEYDKYFKHLTNLGFIFTNNKIQVPDHRMDVKTHNDLAEEVSRIVGYNNISPKKFNINKKNRKVSNNKEIHLKTFLTASGFYEVINNPFSIKSTSNAIEIDNPLDSNKRYLRTNLKESLIKNLLYNERRQQDSIKLFEISNIYSNANINKNEKFVGIIASSRQDKNFEQFSKQITINYLNNIFEKKFFVSQIKIEEISRDNLNSKSKYPIFYFEFALKNFVEDKVNETPNKHINLEYKYKKVSDYPSSIRDLSFSVKDSTHLKSLEEYLLTFKNNLLKEVFIFDFFVSDKIKEVKIGFRFIFQSHDKTITDKEVNAVMDTIIENALKIKSVNIPGL